jgi:hypothetical protein
VGYLLFLKNNERWNLRYLSDLYSFDNFGKKLRFVIVYRLYDQVTCLSTLLVTSVEELSPTISIQDIYRSSR